MINGDALFRALVDSLDKTLAEEFGSILMKMCLLELSLSSSSHQSASQLRRRSYGCCQFRNALCRGRQQ
jgi:hypothetical protein